MPSPLNSHIFPHPRKDGFLSVVYSGAFGAERRSLATGFEMTPRDIEAWTAITIQLCSIHPMLCAPDFNTRRNIEMIDA